MDLENSSNKNISPFPPPRRFCVEFETAENGSIAHRLVECTGTREPIYIEGMESPWQGISIEEIHKYAMKNEYGNESTEILLAAAMIMNEWI